MLGLANTVSSSSTPESKYSLTFEGSDDYLDTGDTFSTTFAGDFSISMWVKPDDGQAPTKYLFGSANSGVNDSVRAFLVPSGKIGFVLEAHDSTATRVDTDAAAFTNGVQTSWTHLGFVANITGTGTTDTTLHVYVNGVEVATTYASQDVTGAEHSQWESDQNLAIGDYNNNGTTGTNSFEGKIDNVALWSVVLDANNVAAIYNSGRPTNLNINSGNYNQAFLLQAYYKMGNGSFDNKANGVIRDQNSSGFESSSLYASNYTSGVDGWTGFGDGDVAGNIDSIDGVDNCLRYTSNSTVGDTRAFLKSDVLTIGKVYKVTFSYYIPSGSNVDALFLDTVAGADDDTRNAVTDAWTTVTEYFTALTADIKIILGDENQYLNPATTNDIAYIKDVSVTNQKIGAGFGSEIFANGWDTLNLASPAVNSNGRITVEENHSGLLHKTGHVSDGDVYKVVMDLETYTGGTIYVGGTNVTPTLGLNTYYIRSAGDNTGFGINNPNNFIASNLSVKKLNGLPALTSGGPTFSSDTP